MSGGTKRAEKNACFAAHRAFRISYFELLSNFDIRISNLAPRTAILFLLLLAATASAQPVTTPSPFYLGGDISLETFMQQQGVVFADSGATKPVDQLLYDRGANIFRMRIFVNPVSTYSGSKPGAIQSQAYDIALAQQIRANAPGAKLLLDFHFSDTWADPGNQTKPAAWTADGSLA